MSCCGAAKVAEANPGGGGTVFLDVTVRSLRPGNDETGNERPLTSVQVPLNATALDVRREIEIDRAELPSTPRAFHFLTPAGAPLPVRHEGARRAVSLRDAAGKLRIASDDVIRRPHQGRQYQGDHKSTAPAVGDVGAAAAAAESKFKSNFDDDDAPAAAAGTAFFAEVHSTVDGAGQGPNAPAESHFDLRAAVVGDEAADSPYSGSSPTVRRQSSSRRMDEIRSRHEKRLAVSRQASLLLDNAARADTQLAGKIEKDRNKHEQKTQARLLQRRQSRGVTTGNGGESKSGGPSIRVIAGESAAAPASLSSEPIDYSTLHTSLPTISDATTMKAHSAKGGVKGAMNYVTQGGDNAGRWPHPSVPMRPGSDGERSIVERLVSTGGMRTAPKGTKKGHFPTTEAAARIAPALGPRLDGVGGFDTANASRDWWCDPSASESFDDVAEAATQERLLRTLFPDMFWNDGGKGKKKKNRHARLNAKGYYFLAGELEMAMCERFTSGRNTGDGNSAGYSWREGRGGRREMLTIAHRVRDQCNAKLRKAGFEENLWLTSLDKKKMELAGHAIDVYAGRVTKSGSRVVRDERSPGYGGYKKYLQFLKELKVGQMTWTSAGWSGGTAGHCVVRITEKTGKDTVAMTFCNSGQGLGSHPGVSVLNSPGPIDNYPRGKPICAMRIDHLSLSSKSMTDLGNWHWLFRCAEYGDRLHPTMNYHYGVTQFAGRTLREAVRDSSDLQGWPSIGQRGPTCGYNGPAKAFQYLLRRFGFSKSDIKEVTHSARLFWCVKMAEQLAAIRCDAGQDDVPLAAAAVPNAGYGSSLWTGAGMGKPPPEMRRVVSKTVWEMVDICCHNLSGSAIKLHDRGRLTDDGLRLSLAVCRRLRQLLPSPSTYWHRLPPALSPFSRPGASGGGGNQQQQSALAPPPATNQPLELLLDWPPINLDAKAGPLDVTQFPPKLAASLVVDNLASAKTLQELLPALQGVVSICRRIRDRFESRGEVAGSKLHVLGLLHSCFAANLGAPCPSPAESRGGEGKAKKTSIPRSPWTMGAITAEFQEQAIDRILDCLCELAAASRSLPRTRATSALDIVAVGYLIASLDAVLLADVNAHGADADAKEQKSGRARTLLWQEHYANLGLCLEQFGGRRFADCTSGCPLDWPGAAVVRADVQAYLDSAATRGLSEDMGSKGQFMNWGGWGAEGEKETVYYLSNQMSPLDPSCEIFRKLAIAMGYNPANNDKIEPNKVTTPGKPVPPLGKGGKDWPDMVIRHNQIYREFLEKDIEFTGTPDKSCGLVSEHMLAIDWGFGSEGNNKIFAQPQGRSLCRVRDAILLGRIMLEPRNTNGDRPISGLKPGKICAWNPEHARPNLCVYGREFNSSNEYLGTRLGITAFNRIWQLGRTRPVADHNLASSLFGTSIRWDADAMLREEKNEDDVLHASKIPNFNGSLSTDDSETLCSFLSVPGLRVSLVLQFFSANSRLTALFSDTLRQILWSSTFCPDDWPKPPSLDPTTGEANPPPPITTVPATNASRLRSRQGLLFVELRTSPEIILKSCDDMVTNAVDVASISDFTTPYASTFFFVVRLAIAVLNYARTVPETFGSKKHWPRDGFRSAPSKEVLEALSAGVETLSSTLLERAVPLCQKWIDQCLDASNGMDDSTASSSSGGGGVNDDDEEDDDGIDPAARLAAQLAYQGRAQEMTITAYAHMFLLSSPSLCGGSSFDFSVDDVGTLLVASSLQSMSYLVEWHGKGLGMMFYGDSATPPTVPPPWRGNKAHAVCGGFREAWPELDLEVSPSRLSDFDPGVLGVAPHMLWSTLARRRRAVRAWFNECHRRNDSSRVGYVLSGILASALGDPSARWPQEKRVPEEEQRHRLSLGTFTHPNGRMRVDTVFAELSFLAGREGVMTMPDTLASNVDLQELLLSARGGVESSIMPHVVARQMRRYMQAYYLPAVTSGDEGLELQYWRPVPLRTNQDDTAYVTCTGFSSDSGLNGRYNAIKKRSCGEPIYRKEGGSAGTLVLRRTNHKGDQNPRGNGDRYHIETERDHKCLAWTPDRLPVGTTAAAAGQHAHWKTTDYFQTGWKDASAASTLLIQSVSELSFGQFVSKPPKMDWDGVLAVHQGQMSDLDWETGWMAFDVYHRQGGYHDVHLTYTAQDSRPIMMRINGTQMYRNIAANTTGGWGADKLKTFNECRVDLGPAGAVARVEFRAEGYSPHLSRMRFDPVDGRRDVEGMPVPQSYNGTPRHAHTGSILQQGDDFEASAQVQDIRIVTFRHRQYGGQGRVCRASIFRTLGLEELCTTESAIPGSDVVVGGRYSTCKMWGYEVPIQATPSSRKWRIVATGEGTRSYRWHVSDLQFLDQRGTPILMQRTATALSCGSTLDAFGPENALKCLPEIHRIDAGGGFEEEVRYSRGSSSASNEEKTEDGGGGGKESTAQVWEGEKLQLPEGARVMSAWYGDGDNGKHVPLQNVKHGMKAHNGMGAGDPAPGRRKKMVVKYVTGVDPAPWIGTVDRGASAGADGAKKEGGGKEMYIGVDFGDREVTVAGFKITQGVNDTNLSLDELREMHERGDDDQGGRRKKFSRMYGASDYAVTVALQSLDLRGGGDGIWRTLQEFTLRESKYGGEVTRILGQSPGGKYGSDGRGNAVANPTAQNCLLGVLANDPREKWVAELLIRCVKPSAKRSLTGDNVIMLFPTTHGPDSTTILMCDPAKPSPVRWSLMVLDRCHHVVNVFALREHGRRCFTQQIWTSDYAKSKHEIDSPRTGETLKWQPHPWERRVSGQLFDDSRLGGWVSGMELRPSVVMVRKMKGNDEVLIPSRYLGGILPDCLTDNFRFWRDGTLHTVVAEKTVEADETWFGYDLEIVVRADDSSGGSGGSGSGGRLRQRSQVRERSQMMATLNLQIKELNRELKASKRGGGSVKAKMKASKRLVVLQRKRQKLQRDGANDGGSRLAAARPQLKMFQIQVPPNTVPGQVLQVQAPSGQTLQVQVPAECGPGTVFQLQDPGSVANASGVPDLAIRFDVYRSRPDPMDPGTMCRHRLVDFTSADVRPGTWLSELCEILERVEHASHVLLWAAVDHAAGKSLELVALHEVVEIIELPRLRLRFTLSLNREGKLRVSSSEHDGLFLVTSQDAGSEGERDDLRRVAGVSEYTLLLGDESGNRYLMVPNCPYDTTRFVWSNYWHNWSVPLRNDPQWLETFEVRVYVYKIHESRLFCEMPSLGAALMWAFLQCADRRWTDAAKTIDCMSSDETFSREERFQRDQWLRLFRREQLVTDPLIGLCVKMFLKFRDSPEAKTWPLPKNPRLLVPNSAHVPAACRVSHEEELRLHRMGLGSEMRKRYILQASQGGKQLLSVVGGPRGASSLGESFRHFALGRDEGSAFSILRDAMKRVKKAEATYENVGGWVRLDNTFMHDYRNRRGPPKHKENDVFDSLDNAKKAYTRLQKHEDERERPRGITFYDQKYGLRFSIRTDRSGSNETSWYKVRNKSGVDPRGSRASLWRTKTVMYDPPTTTRLQSGNLLRQGAPLHEFLHDELDGSTNGLGFLFACQVLGADGGNNKGKYHLSVDGSQDNTETLMGQAVHVYYNDRGTEGSLGLDNSVPMAILAVLATHKVGSIPNFPSIDRAHFARGRKAQELLRSGETAGCMDSLHRHIREETDESQGHYRYHLGGWLSKAAEATLAFLKNGKLEKKTRCGVATYAPARPVEDHVMPPDESVLQVSADGKTQHVSIVTLDNRYGRKLPRPIDFSSDSFTLSPSVGRTKEELAELASFPLLDVLRQAKVSAEPALPENSDPSTVIKFQTALSHVDRDEEAAAEQIKEDDKRRPKLPLPIPRDSDDASSPIGSAMIERFEKSAVDHDVRLRQLKRRNYALSLTTRRQVSDLHRECVELLRKTVASVRRESKELEYHLNRSTSQPNDPQTCGYVGLTGYLRHQLMKASWLEPHVEMPLLLGSVLSSDGVRQVRNANPMLNDATCKDLIERAALLMLRTSKVSQLRRTIGEIVKSFPFVVAGRSDDDGGGGGGGGGGSLGANPPVGGIGRCLTSQRHWATILPTGGIRFDPRFLSFEFVSGYMMWERQTNLVRDFYAAAVSGNSETQQMIMGDGKTTVVGPMLTLMLGGARACTIVCPRALIVQTKSIMRQIFSAPLTPKPVLTLKFDRGRDSRVSSLRLLREKLEGAHHDLGIVIASPTSIKSYFLKYIELLVMLRANRIGGRATKTEQKEQKKKEKRAAAARGGKTKDSGGGDGSKRHAPLSKWYCGPRTWKTGQIPIVRVSRRPDHDLPFVPSKVCVVPAPGSRMTCEILEGGRPPCPFPKGTVVESAWYVNRNDTDNVFDQKFTERIREGEEGGECSNVQETVQGWFDSGRPLQRVDNVTMGGDPCPNRPKSLLLTVYFPDTKSGYDYVQQAIETECCAIIPSETFLDEGRIPLQFPLSRLPPVGAYEVVYLRGMPVPPNKMLGYQGSARNAPNPDFRPTMENGGYDQIICGEAVGVSIVPYATDGDEYLEEGSELGDVGPAGYGLRTFDPERGYCLVCRNDAPDTCQSFDPMRSRMKYLKQRVVRLDLNGRNPERWYQGWKNGDEAMFLGVGWGEGWTRQMVGGPDGSRDTEPAEFFFTPSRRGDHLMRIEAYWGDRRKRYHLGAGGPNDVEEKGRHERGRHHGTKWHTSLLPLRTEDDRKVPLSEQHVWRIVLDRKNTELLGRRCWHVVYAGPNEKCLGWVLSLSPYEHEWMFLFDPNACASSRINHDCGRNQYGRTGPGTFEIVECGFGNDYRGPIRMSVNGGRKHLVRLDLPCPEAATRSFADDPDDRRWERGVGKKKCRTNGSPFYVKYTGIQQNHNIGEEKDSATRVDLCCRVRGTFVEIHFCKGNTMDTAVRSYRVPSDLQLVVSRRVHVEDPSKVVQYAENDTHFVVRFLGGFIGGSHYSNLDIHGVSGLGGPPPGGSIVVAIEKDTLGGKGGGRLGHNGIPKALSEKGRNVRTIKLNTSLEEGTFTAIETLRETNSRICSGDYGCRGLFGWVEYTFVLPESSLVDVGITYCHTHASEMILYLNGHVVDRHMASKCQNPNQTTDWIDTWSENGPHLGRKGHNVVRLETNWHHSYPGYDRSHFNQLNYIFIRILPNSKGTIFKRGRPTLSLRATSGEGGAASLTSTTGQDEDGDECHTVIDMSTALRLLPDAFGIDGAIAFQPAASTSSLLGLPPVEWPDPRDDDGGSTGGGEGIGVDGAGSGGRFGPEEGFVKIRTALEIATSDVPDNGSAIWSGDYEKGDPSRPKRMVGDPGYGGGGGGTSSFGGAVGAVGAGGLAARSPVQDFVAGGVQPGQPVILNDVPSSVVHTLNLGGKGNRLETTVSGVALYASEGNCGTGSHDAKIQHVRFDYASGRSRSHGTYRGGQEGNFLGYFSVPYGTYLVQVNAFYDVRDPNIPERGTLRGMQFVCANEHVSSIYGHQDCEDSFEEQNVCCDQGHMLTWLRFRADSNANEAHNLMDVEESCVQSPAEPLQRNAVLQGICLRRWSTTCAFYPRMSKFIEGTVSFELVHFPGHYLVASKSCLDAVVDGRERTVADASLDDPHLTIERLEPPNMWSLSHHHDPTDQPLFQDRETSLPLCDETYRRASFAMTELTDGTGVDDDAMAGGVGESGGAGGKAVLATLAAELDDVAESGAADDDLGAASDEIRRVLNMWRTRGVLLMDEVDLLLHPLKSELNFPIGDKIEIDVDVDTLGASGITAALESGSEEEGSSGGGGGGGNMPKGLRWDLPIAVLGAMLEADAIMSGRKVLGESEMPSHYITELMSTFQRGREEKVIQTIPHLILLPDSGGGGPGKKGKASVADDLKTLSGVFIVGWIESHQLVRWTDRKYARPPAIATKDLLAYIMHPEGANWSMKEQFDRCLAPATLQILLLARLWLSCYLLHGLQKINRVNYGLLRGWQLKKEAGSFFDSDADKTKKKKKSAAANAPQVPPSRLLLALPFVGLEQPAESAEFAHPDVAIALTILAYRHEGLREQDMRTMVERFKALMQTGVGPVEKRPEWILWDHWANDAVQRLRDRGLDVVEGIYPLDMFQPDDESSFKACYRLWKNYNPAIDYYLRTHVFPRVMRCQEEKISASGQALGSSLLFNSRLAFSGTPSDLLPREESEASQLFPCKFERGSEAKIMHTLTDPKRVSVRRSPDHWSVEAVLRQIAHADQNPDLGRIDVLIDVGALITGLSNQDVAQFLLDEGLSWAKGVVFLDPHDEKCILLRSGGGGGGSSGDGGAAGSGSTKGKVMKLAQCGLAWSERFSFYDQIHTTGMDIKQHSRAKACITVGKDTTFRDFAQGAYRMRAFAKGMPQTLEILLVPEVLGLVRKEVGDASLGKPPNTTKMRGHALSRMNDKALTAVGAWLLLNQIRLESKQMLQLCVQNIDGVTRRTALRKLLSTTKGGTEETLALTEAFTEEVNVRIPTEVPTAQTFVASLEERLNENERVVPSDAAGKKCIGAMLSLARDQTERATARRHKGGTSSNDAKGGEGAAWARKDLDAAQTRTQEKEQELEQEKQKQREIEREASPWKATTRDHSEPIVWHLQDLISSKQQHPASFFEVGRFKLRSRPGEDQGKAEVKGDLLAKIKAPNVYLSENFCASRFTSPRARRLRSLHTVLQWNNASKTNLDHTVALNLLEAATVRRWGGESAEYPRHLRLSILPRTSILVGAKSPDAATQAAREVVRASELHRRGGRAGGKRLDSETRSPNLLAVRAAAASLDGQSNRGVQLLRFFDCQTVFSEAEGSSLLSTLASVPPDKRQKFFTTTIMSRRREQNKWGGTSLVPYMQLRSYDDLVHVRELKKSILGVMERRGLNATDLARMIDVDKDMSLSIDEIVACMSSRDMQKEKGMPSPKRLTALKGPLLLVADKRMDGRVSYEEFEEFLLSQ